MDNETKAKIRVLEAALKKPEGRYTYAEIREKLGTLKVGAGKGAFVDRVDNGIASVQDAKGNFADIPATPDMAEGGYVGGTPSPGMPTGEQINGLRSKLAAGDPGGPIDLSDKPDRGPAMSLPPDVGESRAPAPPPPMSPLRSSQLPMEVPEPPAERELPPLPEPREGYFHSMGREYPDTNNWVSNLARGINFFDTAGMAANKAIDTMTGGVYSQGLDGWSKALGTQIGPSLDDFERFRRESPLIEGLTEFGANVAPGSLASRATGYVSRVADPLLTTVARRAQRYATPERVKKVKDLAQSVISAAGGGAITTNIEDNVRGDKTNEQMRQRMGESALTSGVVGGGLHGLHKGANKVADLIESVSPRIKALGKYGMEPGPFPGRPVIRKDEGLLAQLPGISKPPLVSRATPATRAEAARAGAEELVPDIEAVARVSNQRYGQVKEAAKRTQGAREIATVEDYTRAADKQLRNEKLPDSTKDALGRLKTRIVGDPLSREQELSKFDSFMKNPKNNPNEDPDLHREYEDWRTFLENAPPRYREKLTAQTVDEIRDYADTLGNQEKAVKASDVPLRKMADMMRQDLADKAPHIAIVNKQQEKTLSGIEERQALLNLPRSVPRGPAARKKVMKSATRAVRQSGEESATGGAGNLRGQTEMERLGEMGRPPIFPGVEGEGIPSQNAFARRYLEPSPSYQGEVAPSQLQLHQEGLQALPSQMFSAKTAGAALMSLPMRFAGLVPERGVYPLARRLGARAVGSGPFAIDELTTAIGRAMGQYEKGARERAIEQELEQQADAARALRAKQGAEQ